MTEIDYEIISSEKQFDFLQNACVELVENLKNLCDPAACRKPVVLGLMRNSPIAAAIEHCAMSRDLIWSSLPSKCVQSTEFIAQSLELLEPDAVIVDNTKIIDCLKRWTQVSTHEKLGIHTIIRRTKKAARNYQLPLDICKIRFTSGSSGLPKLAAYTKRQLDQICANISKTLPLNESQKLILPMPLSWAAGSLLPPALQNGMQVCIQEQLDLSVLLDGNAKRDLFIFLTPSIARSLCRRMQSVKFSSRNRITWLLAGEPTSFDTVHRLMAIAKNSRIHVAFGMSEASLPILFKPDANVMCSDSKHEVFCSLGKLSQGYRKSSLSYDTGEARRGRLVVRGSQVASNVISHNGNNFVLNSEIDSDDLFEMSAGEYWYRGRSNSILHTSGGMVPATLLEGYIESALLDVRRCIASLNATGKLVIHYETIRSDSSVKARDIYDLTETAIAKYGWQAKVANCVSRKIKTTFTGKKIRNG